MSLLTLIDRLLGRLIPDCYKLFLTMKYSATYGRVHSPKESVSGYSPGEQRVIKKRRSGAGKVNEDQGAQR